MHGHLNVSITEDLNSSHNIFKTKASCCFLICVQSAVLSHIFVVMNLLSNPITK